MHSNFIVSLYNSKNNGVVCGHFARTLYTLVDDAQDGECTTYSNTASYTLEDVYIALEQLEQIYHVLLAAKRFYNDNGGYSDVQLNAAYANCIQAIASHSPEDLIVTMHKQLQDGEMQDALYALRA